MTARKTPLGEVSAWPIISGPLPDVMMFWNWLVPVAQVAVLVLS
jgi:hypothetical protein